jgi:hypothetical protein
VAAAAAVDLVEMAELEEEILVVPARLSQVQLLQVEINLQVELPLILI